ncbi:non-homologous end-joining DNA ligase [Clostridium sp. 'deep sea']|uniref:non-homologous end-joining DNA ligase n=1 Tax=Clostridium sp. 'deep sea' TaxID=2779445 RepID=UPI0018965E0F|nr:non-homologous end-joining DNA ligase [Clostridium sp. 'deep sea']QOR33845.1 non-homologous end-joining DNA ligase [Clostridium sp. 'deep sea']
MNNFKISNPNKLLWPKLGIKKIDYLNLMYELSPYILKYAQNRKLTVIRYPDGVAKKSFYQKNLPDYAPSWVEQSLNSADILLWMANQAALEFHTCFNTLNNANNPTSLVFDLDPSKNQTFEQVMEVALLIYETLTKLNIKSYVKTSGSTGLQIYIPVGCKYSYENARKINEFFAKYFAQSYPTKISIERLIKNRGNKLYFDYLQMWKGKTIITPYSTRAVENARIATPITWQELKQGIDINDFNFFSIKERLAKKGDLFSNMENDVQDLDFILKKL